MPHAQKIGVFLYVFGFGFISASATVAITAKATAPLNLALWSLHSRSTRHGQLNRSTTPYSSATMAVHRRTSCPSLGGLDMF